MKFYHYAEAYNIENLNYILSNFERKRWVPDGKLIVIPHGEKVIYLQRLVYKRTWGEYIKHKFCIK